MKTFTMFFMAVAIFFSPNFSQASIPSNVGMSEQELHFEVDQAQEAAEEFEQLRKPFNVHVNSVEELYQYIVDSLNAEIKLKEKCGFDAEPCVIFTSDMLSEEVWLDLEAKIKSQNLIRMELVVMYENSPVGVKVTEQELQNMSETEWKAICELGGFYDKEGFIAMSEASLVYIFSLIP